MKKILILRQKGVNNFLIKKLDFCDVTEYYKVNFDNIIYKIIRKLNITFLCGFILGKWINSIKKYNVVILLDFGYSKIVTDSIKKKNKNAKVILYCWNIINREFYSKISKDKNVDEIWTFDKEDAIKYNLKYNPQFYSKDVILPESNVKYDIIFLGRAKNRKNEILELKEKFESMQLKCDFFIIENEKECIEYDKYLKLISQSKAVLDYNQKSQIGLTLRPMEALFFEKKLITNNKDIVNYDFYNPKNIFILGIDDMKNIKEFINSDYEKVDQKIIDYYDFENWIQRFN